MLDKRGAGLQLRPFGKQLASNAAERQFCFPFYSFVKLLDGAIIDIP